jgi:hypothetical protein
VKRFLTNNGLSIALFALFFITLLGQSLTGWREDVHTSEQHGEAVPTYVEYVRSGSFLEATMENWESEFFQMFVYVIFTVFLYQKGSAESKDPDTDPRLRARDKLIPRRRTLGTWVYENSLSLTFLGLFLLAFALHAAGGASAYNDELRAHGRTSVSIWEYMASARFWFESLQNWQSEFLAIAAMVVLSIFLRQRGSPESKPVEAPHSSTGS